MKQKFRLIMLLLLVASLMFAGACVGTAESDPEGDGTDTETPVTEAPAIPGAEGLSVDVTERPEGFSIGSYTFSEAYLNEEKLASDDYVLRNNRFMFAYDFYGEIGVGDYNVKLVFEELVKEFPLKVSDKKAPVYSFNLAKTSIYNIEEQIILPVVDRLNEYQDYNVRYLIYKGSDAGELIYNQTDVEKTADSIKYEAGALGMGDYVYKVQIRKASQTIKEYMCNFSVVKYANDIFLEENFANWKMVSTAITKNFEDGAVNFIPRESNGLNGRYFFAYYSIDFMREAQLKGCETFTFEYKVNEVMAATPDNSSQEKPDQLGGLRIFAKVNDGFDSAAGNGIVTDEEAGLFVFESYTDLPTEWTTVSINISDFLALSPDTKFIGIVVSGQAGSVASFRNARFI